MLFNHVNDQDYFYLIIINNNSNLQWFENAMPYSRQQTWSPTLVKQLLQSQQQQEGEKGQVPRLAHKNKHFDLSN